MLPLPPSLSAIICISCSPALTSSGCTLPARSRVVASAALTGDERDALGLGRGDLRAERVGLHRNDDDGVDALR